MDHDDILHSFSTGGGFLSEPYFDSSLGNIDDLLNNDIANTDYNLLDLDNYVPEEPLAPEIENNKCIESNKIKQVPNVFLLDSDCDRFEELLKSNIVEKRTGNWKNK